MVTKSLALEFGPKGIRVNSVNPGLIDTPIAQKCSLDPNVLEETKRSFSVFQRAGEAEEVAKAVAFLASNTSSFVTGTNVVVDGGHLLK
ncbi:short-chain dehydrogenase-like protein [Dinothrombium tinctorium]|nr:short-chain dehydrogenase-like protein [Dinothrombium tinctorium]RWS04543.1 short-chain dehydrogenase-like protein [Dinothrombium tinctorium]